MKKIKNVLVLIGFLLMSVGVFAQGLYEKKSDESSSSLYSNSSDDKPVLRAGGGGHNPPGGEDGAEAGNGSPVSGGVLILTALSGLYGARLYFASKRRKKV